MESRSTTKSSGGENRWLEQCSRNTDSISKSSSHIPHPKDLDKIAFPSAGDMNLLLQAHSPSLIFGTGPAIPLETGYNIIFFDKHSSRLSITPVGLLLTVMK